MNYLGVLLCLVLSYLIGSIPFGLLIGKIFKKTDIRNFGSKSTGATNAMRVLGLKYGLLAFLLDGIKGVLVIAPISLLGLTELYEMPTKLHTLNILPLYGVFAVAGHVFSVYIGFKGGKAVATSLGILVALLPLVSLAALIIFIIVLLVTRYVSLASVIAASGALVITIIDFIWGDLPIEYLITFIILVGFIILRHLGNFRRLKAGTENKV